MSSAMTIIVYSIIIIGIGFMITYVISKKNQGSESWINGGRSLPLYVTIGTQFAAIMGGGFVVAHVGIGYNYGWSVLTYGVIMASIFFALCFIADWLRKESFNTVPDILEKLYGKNKALALLATLSAMIVPFGWLCTQLVAFSKLFSSIIGVDSTVLIIIFATLCLIFVLPAGLASVAWTDFFFGCMMLVITVTSVFFLLDMNGGFAQMIARVPAELTSFPKGMSLVGWGTIILWLTSVIPGGITNQLAIQRICAIKDVKSVKKSLIITGIIIIFVELWSVITGVGVRSLMPGLEGEMATGWFLSQIPKWFMGLFSGFLMVSIISTVNGSIQSVVVSVSQDLFQKVIPLKEGSNPLLITRISAVVVTYTAALLAIIYPQALQWLIISYGLSAVVLLAPIYLGYLLRDHMDLNYRGAILSMVVGIGCMLITKSFLPSIPFTLPGIGGSAFTLYVYHALFHRKLVSKEVENINIKGE